MSEPLFMTFKRVADDVEIAINMSLVEVINPRPNEPDVSELWIGETCFVVRESFDRIDRRFNWVQRS